MKKIIGVVSVAVLAGMMIFASPTCAQFFMDNPIVGEKASGFVLMDLGGVKQDFFTMTAGKDAIVFFWATWCPHCREQLKELHAKSAQIQSAGVTLVLVDLGEDAKIVKAYLKENKIDFPVLLDEAGSVAETYKVLGIPTFIFIDKRGVVRRVEHYLPDDYQTSFQPKKQK